jgi:hypothetical protein
MRRPGLVELPIEVRGFPLKPQRMRLEWGKEGCSAGGAGYGYFSGRGLRMHCIFSSAGSNPAVGGNSGVNAVTDFSPAGILQLVGTVWNPQGLKPPSFAVLIGTRPTTRVPRVVP